MSTQPQAAPYRHQGAAQAAQDPTYNRLYEKLVHNESDLVGAFAYLEYKRAKIAYCKEIFAQTGKNPTDSEMTAFTTQAGTDHQINSYRVLGERLAEVFLRAGLEKKIKEIENDVRLSTVGVQMRDLGTTVDQIRRKLDEPWSLSKWANEVATYIAVAVLSILLIGGAYWAYANVAKFNEKVETVAGMHSGNAKEDSSKAKAPGSNSSPAEAKQASHGD